MRKTPKLVATPADRAVLYARVSSKEQDKDGYSIPAQQRLLHDYAKSNGIEVVREFIDVETAKRAGRTAFGEMLDFLRENPSVRVVLVEKTDRLYRNISDWVTIDDFEVDLHFVKEGQVLTPRAKSSEKFVHGIKVLMAKNYVDNLSEETRKGMLEKAEQGLWPSYAPLGYRNVEGVDGKRIIEPDPDLAPVVAQLFEWYAEGRRSLREVAKMARDAGLRTRKSGDRVSTTTVHKILTNLIYTGDFAWDGRRYQGRHEPIVDPELFARVQATLRGRAASKRRRDKHDFTYWGLASCGHCGCAVVGEVKKERYVYYRPTRHPSRCTQACGRGYVREGALDAQVEALLDSLRFDPEVIDWIRAALKESHADERRFREGALARLKAEMDRCQTRIETAYLDKLEGRIDADFFDRMSAQWREEQGSCRSRIEELSVANEAYYEDGLRLIELARGASELWKRQTSAEKRKLLGYLVSNGSLDGEALTFELRQPFDLLRETVAEHEREVAAMGRKTPDLEKWLPGSVAN
jgi:DNA invertase Pin-like site-specific DNA recombinase